MCVDVVVVATVLHTSQRRPFFKAQFHFKTQKQRFSDNLKVKSVVVVIANFCDDHLFVCVCAIIKLEKNI